MVNLRDTLSEESWVTKYVDNLFIFQKNYSEILPKHFDVSLQQLYGK